MNTVKKLLSCLCSLLFFLYCCFLMPTHSSIGKNNSLKRQSLYYLDSWFLPSLHSKFPTTCFLIFSSFSWPALEGVCCICLVEALSPCPWTTWRHATSRGCQRSCALPGSSAGLCWQGCGRSTTALWSDSRLSAHQYWENSTVSHGPYPSWITSMII